METYRATGFGNQPGRASLEVLRPFAAFNELSGNLTYGYSTAPFGNMAYHLGSQEEVHANRRRFVAAMGGNTKMHNGVYMAATHSDVVEIVTADERGRGVYSNKDMVNADALVTTCKRVMLGLASGDCNTIIATDLNAQIVALIHAGRIGTEKGIVTKTVEQMLKMGFSPRELLFGFGPAIEKSCYMYPHLRTNNPDFWPAYLGSVPASNGEFQLVETQNPGGERFRILPPNDSKFVTIDTVTPNVDQLVKAGVPEENILLSNECTVHNAARGRLFSHSAHDRYAGTSEGYRYPEGRFLALAQLN